MSYMKDAAIDKHNEGCGDMSVDEWLQAFFEAATCDGATFVGNEEAGIDEIKRELRKAVVREASVGVVKLVHNGVASDYDIVPHKETP